MAKVARMYYSQGLRQTEITGRLNIHQSTVSRLLKRAEKEGIVRITLSVPSGTHPDLEERLQSRFGLREAIVVDSIDDEEQIVRDLGAAAAFYLETTLRATDVIGISSWSAALLAMVDAMHPSQRFAGAKVVQILGGVGNPGAEAHATHLTRRLAKLLSGQATLLPAPGVVGISGGQAGADERQLRSRGHRPAEGRQYCPCRHRCRRTIKTARVERQRVLAPRAQGVEREGCGRGYLSPLLRRRRSPGLDPIERSGHQHRSRFAATNRSSRGRRRGPSKDRGHPWRTRRALGQCAHHRSRHRATAAVDACCRRASASRRGSRASSRVARARA